MISVSCSCGRRFKAEDHHAGKRTHCPVCGKSLVIGRPPAADPSYVSDNAEVPSWWFPSSSPARVNSPGKLSPTQSGSGSDPDEIQTAIVPASKEVPPQAAGNHSAERKIKPPSPALNRATVLLAMTFSILVLLVLAAVIWLQPRHENLKSTVATLPKPQSEVNDGVEDPDRHGASSRTPIPGRVQPAEVATGLSTQATVPLASRLQILVPAYFLPLRLWAESLAAAD